MVADSGYAVLELLADAAGLIEPVTVITRLRLDAALYDPAPPRPAGQRGRPRRKGARQPTLAARVTDLATRWHPRSVVWYGSGPTSLELATGTATWYHSGLPSVAIRWVLIRDPQQQFTAQALLSTDLTASPEQIVTWFVERWQLEVTFQEVRAHLGLETQRQWSDLAILRTTPALLGLFSLVTLYARELLQGAPLPPRQAAWYTKPAPTFSDTLALVRRQLWSTALFSTSPPGTDLVQIPRAFLDHVTETLAYAA